MISLAEAQELIAAEAKPLGIARAALAESLGQVLAEPIAAPLDVPFFDNSAVDGFAVQASDLPGRLPIAGSTAAGDAPLPMSAGTTVRVYTGSPVPPESDAVVMQEDVVVSHGIAEFKETPRSGAHIRRKGEELRHGGVAISAGTVVTPAVVAAAAALGIVEGAVCHPPRVAIVATGSELVEPGSPLQPGQIFGSNAAGLKSACEAMGLSVVFAQTVRDECAETMDALSAALSETDILVTTGGVSVGEHDLIRRCLAELGVKEVFWRIAVKPGKPTFFGVGGRRLIFGLPGNPVPALLLFAMLVRPAILQMLGRERELDDSACLTAGVSAGDRYELVRAKLNGSAVRPVEGQGSHMASGLANADCVIHVPPSTSFEAGDSVTITKLRWGLF